MNLAGRILTRILTVLLVGSLILAQSPLGALAQSGGEIVVSKEFKISIGGSKFSTFGAGESVYAEILVRNNSGDPKNVVVKDEMPGSAVRYCDPSSCALGSGIVTFSSVSISSNSEMTFTYRFNLPTLPAGGFGAVGGVATQKNRVWGTKVKVEEGGKLVASFEAPVMIRGEVPEIKGKPDELTGRDTLWELATKLIKDGKLKARGGASLLRWGFGWRQAQYGRSRGGEVINTYTKVKKDLTLVGQALIALFNNPSLFIFGNVFAYSTAGGRIDFGNQGVVSGTGVYGAPTQKFAIPNYSIDPNSAIYWDSSKGGPEKNQQINENLKALEDSAALICNSTLVCTISGNFNLNPPKGPDGQYHWSDLRPNDARPEGGVWKVKDRAQLQINGNVTFHNKGLIIVETVMFVGPGSGSSVEMSYGTGDKSLGVIIKNGDLVIGNATKVVGAYFVPGPQAPGAGGRVIFGKDSPGVFVKGSLIAKDFEFNPRSSRVTEATAEGTGLTDFQGAIVYDANLIRNPPPGFANLFSAVVKPALPE